MTAVAVTLVDPHVRILNELSSGTRFSPEQPKSSLHFVPNIADHLVREFWMKTRDTQTIGSCVFPAAVYRWDEFCMAESATTINENGVRWQYAVPRRVVQRSPTLLVLESPWMSLTRDALWHNGL